MSTPAQTMETVRKILDLCCTLDLAQLRWLLERLEAGLPTVGPAAVSAPPASGVLTEVAAELAQAQARHGPMRGPHEGYAVLLEELDELWDEVKKRTPDHDLMRKEAIQVGAMALRFLVDVCGPASDDTGEEAE